MVKLYDSKNIRNIGLFGHRGSGKTSLAEAFLFNTKVTTRLGSVDAGTSTFDYLEEEQAKKFTISATPGWIDWQNHKINVIDTPGDLNFLGEAINIMNVIDLAVFVISASGGVEVGTEILWAEAEKRKLPRMILINKADREFTDPMAILNEVKKNFLDSPVLPLQLPIGKAVQFEGVVDLVNQKAYRFAKDNSGNMQEGEIPAQMKDAVAENREALMFKVAETDEELEMKLLEMDELSEEEFQNGLKVAIRGGTLIPVLFSSGTANIGLQPICDIIVNYGPTPLDRLAVKAYNNDDELVDIEPKSTGPFTALVFKTILSRVGKFGLFRIFSGTTDGSMDIYNTTQNGSSRLGNLLQFQGKDQENLERAVAGDIVGVAKLKDSRTGDTLCSSDRRVRFDLIKSPTPVIGFAVKCADEDKTVQGLTRLAEEDIALILERDPNTNDLLLKGQGQGHIDVIIERLRNQFKQEVELLPRRVAYKETIRTSVTNIEGKLKKQSGGRGQFGVCVIDMKPAQRGDGFVFEDGIVGGVIPRQYIPAVQKGIEEASQRGTLAGYPTIDFHVRLFDGKTHAVDSSEQAFKMAGIFAFRNAVEKCNPILLEPYIILEVTVPSDYQGDISGDLNRRRGRIEETTYRGKNVTIRAKVPEAEILTYANQLTSMTEGRGTFSMTFSHYEDVPPPIQKQIVEQAKVNRTEE
jgi:elongation factor G